MQSCLLNSGEVIQQLNNCNEGDDHAVFEVQYDQDSTRHHIKNLYHDYKEGNLIIQQ